MIYVTNGSKSRRHQHRFSWNFKHARHLLCTIFVRKTAGQKYFFQILSQKTAQTVNLKNLNLDLIRRIHPDCGFYKFMIPFQICQKSAKTVFGFGNPDLVFPQKRTLSRNILNKHIFFFSVSFTALSSYLIRSIKGHVKKNCFRTIIYQCGSKAKFPRKLPLVIN